MLSTVLRRACGVMTDLAIHPLEFEADAGGAGMLAVMDRRALVTRSRGPYSAQNPPPEAMATAESVALRLSMLPESPQFTVDVDGPWPRLTVAIEPLRLLVRFVVPEDAPPVYQPKSNNVTLVGDIKMALEQVASSLEVASRELGGQEPPIRITLSYPDDPGYEQTVASLPVEFRDILAPVIPTIELDRTRCGSRERAAHDEALRAVAYSDQRLEPLGRNGFTTRVGSARIRDGGD